MELKAKRERLAKYEASDQIMPKKKKEDEKSAAGDKQQ